MTNQNFLICLVGLPASGKSNFANKLKIALKEKFENLNSIIIDPDIIRYNLTQEKFDPEKEQIIRKENLRVIRNELKEGNIVISDDLNYYTSMRHELKDIAENLNLFLFIIYIATPIEICLKWNEKRGRPIPNTVIYKINERFDKFNKYKWDNPDVVYDLSQITDLNQKIEETLTKIQAKRELIKSKSKIVEWNNVSSNINNERLDRITRLYVNTLLLDSAYLPLRKRIIKLRKNYVKKNKNKALRKSEILKGFKKFLEKHLSLKIPEKI